MTTQTTQQPQVNKTVVHPLVDVLENDNEFLLVADLPGVTKDALHITANGNQLEIAAETDSLDYRRGFALGDDVTSKRSRPSSTTASCESTCPSAPKPASARSALPARD